MNWYYAEGGKQIGPISEVELDELFRVGRISASTLVWREGLTGWQPYSAVRPSAATTNPNASAGEPTAVPPISPEPGADRPKDWFYEESGKPAGPVGESELDALVTAGRISSTTRVWRAGMTNWQTYAAARGTGGATPALGENEVICAECGKVTPRGEAFLYGKVWICAACKPVFLQKLREGVSIGGAPGGLLPNDPEELLRLVNERDYRLSMGRCIERGWRVVKDNLGLTVGATFLVGTIVMGIAMAGNFIPGVGSILQAVIQGPLMGGLYYMFLKLLRGEQAALGDAFSGFSRSTSQLILGSFVQGLIMIVAMIPLGLVAGVSYFAKVRNPGPLLIGLALASIAVIIYLSVAWFFSLPLIIDKRMSFWPAMELSRKVISKHWFWMGAFGIVNCLLVLAGFLALCVGVFVAAPVVMAAYSAAYDDVLGTGAALGDGVG